MLDQHHGGARGAQSLQGLGEARLGFGVIANTGAVISHDCVLGDYTNISPGALLAGEVHTGAGTLFDVLRRYVESRLEMPIKAGRLLP